MSDAAQRFIDILGPDQVTTSAPALDAAGSTTFPTDVRVAGILRPTGREQVRAAVRLANELGVPLYPISTGKNWGYGSRVPTADQAFLLDLSRMNRIVDYDERLAYVTVEPGVTQRQLYEFLRAQRSQLWLDATGSSPDASLIGNTLE